MQEALAAQELERNAEESGAREARMAARIDALEMELSECRTQIQQAEAASRLALLVSAAEEEPETTVETVDTEPPPEDGEGGGQERKADWWRGGLF
jgi:hypothetical protein